MVRLTILKALVCALLAAGGARAETPEIVRRLKAEPLTLFDWGLAQLDRDIERAAQRLVLERRVDRRPETGAIYDWRGGRVTLFLALQTPAEARTRAACTALFDRTVGELIAAAPAGSSAAGWYLQNAFQPKAHFWASRFEDVGAKLLEVVRLEVSLIAPPQAAAVGDSRRVRCSGRLDAAPEAILLDVSG